jgi:hypothetical protein
MLNRSYRSNNRAVVLLLALLVVLLLATLLLLPADHLAALAAVVWQLGAHLAVL